MSNFPLDSMWWYQRDYVWQSPDEFELVLHDDRVDDVLAVTDEPDYEEKHVMSEGAVVGVFLRNKEHRNIAFLKLRSF